MSWNDGYERTQFQKKQRELIKEYRAIGSSWIKLLRKTIRIITEQ